MKLIHSHPSTLTPEERLFGLTEDFISEQEHVEEMKELNRIDAREDERITDEENED